jgi:hypothetical protein
MENHKVKQNEKNHKNKSIEEKHAAPEKDPSPHEEKEYIPPSDDYTIKFSIKYSTQPGENIYIVGNLKELGNWKENKFKLKWTEGHIWKGKLNLPSEIENFSYKFICASDKQVRWEEGPNRIFDKTQYEFSKQIINLDCIWEHFTISFNIFYPLANSTEYLQIIGGVSGLGSWFKDGGHPVKMILTDPKTIGGKIKI